MTTLSTLLGMLAVFTAALTAATSCDPDYNGPTCKDSPAHKATCQWFVDYGYPLSYDWCRYRTFIVGELEAPFGTNCRASCRMCPCDDSSEANEPTPLPTHPPTESATYPPTESTTYPPTESTTYPPTESTTQPPTESTTKPPVTKPTKPPVSKPTEPLVPETTPAPISPTPAPTEPSVPVGCDPTYTGLTCEDAPAHKATCQWFVDNGYPLSYDWCRDRTFIVGEEVPFAQGCRRSCEMCSCHGRRRTEEDEEVSAPCGPTRVGVPGGELERMSNTPEACGCAESCATRQGFVWHPRKNKCWCILSFDGTVSVTRRSKQRVYQVFDSEVSSAQ